MLNRDRILLVYPLGYRSDAARNDIARIANIMPPLGLASIAAYLERRGLRAAIVDCFAFPDSDRRIRDHLLAEKPAFVGLSCTTSGFLDGVRIAEMARATLPGVRTVFGGPHVSALGQTLFPAFPAVDFAVVGEGEETLAELMASGGDDPASVRGLVYRDPDGSARFTGRREGGIDLDSLPFPAYEKLAGYPAAYSLPIFNYPTVPNCSAISSRGCLYSCSYCDRSVFRRSFRCNSAEYLYEHVRYLNARFGIRHINFYDDQFTFDRARIERFTGMMAERPPGMTFNCIVRAEHVDADLARRMKAAGCWMMNLGIETGDRELLARHRPHGDLDRIREAVRTIKAAGIRAKGLLMMGLPGESEDSIRRTREYLFSLPVDDFNMAKFTPFPGSPIYRKIRELGAFDEDWEKMDCMNFQFVPHGMTAERLERLFRDFHRAHYSRTKVLLGYIAMLWRSPDSCRRFAAHVGDFLRFTRVRRRLMDLPREEDPRPRTPGPAAGLPAGPPRGGVGP